MLIARPLRVYAYLGLAVLGWLAWRLPAMQHDIAHLQAPSAIIPAPPDRAGQPRLGHDPARIAESVPGADLPAFMHGSAPHAPLDATAGGIRLRMHPSVFAADGSLTAPEAATAEPPPPPATPPPQARPVLSASPSAAERGYELLSAGKRHAAAAAFREAIAQQADDPRVPQWRAQLRYLEKRWSGTAYVLARNSGKLLPTATIPALTAAQSGALLAYTLNPLDAQPLGVQGRIVTANDGVALSTGSAQAAVAVTWRPTPAVQVAAERLIRAGRKSRNAWTVRVAAGGEAPRPAGRKAWNAWSAYAETGIVGTKRQDLYAASSARVGRAFALNEKVALTLGGGIWASVQHYDRTAHWIEVGPTAQLRIETAPPVNVALDYRWRINGNADPGTGPALTVATGF